jgi:hypothetical protein
MKIRRAGVVVTLALLLVATALAGVTLLVVVVPERAETTLPGKNGRITYSANDGPDSEIYTIRAGGGGRFNVTYKARDDSDPCYSPSCKKIAYSGKERPNADTEIYTISTGGGGKFNVTDNGTEDYSPSWGSR